MNDEPERASGASVSISVSTNMLRNKAELIDRFLFLKYTTDSVSAGNTSDQICERSSFGI